MIKPFYFDNRALFILDQRRLPREEVWLKCEYAAQVADAIKTLAVRGAPAIGIAAAYGMVLAGSDGSAKLEDAARALMASRPTAVNLEWAVRRMLAKVAGIEPGTVYEVLKAEADLIWEEEIEANRVMARNAMELFPGDKEYTILTHCNAGALATGGMGTALGIIRQLHAEGRLAGVYADETRPLLQGARITAYELEKDGIPVTLITDNMAGWVMRQGRIDAVVVGADRIAANHDAANKIGTYSLAVLADYHKIPFYIAAPVSTCDPQTAEGDAIIIEERAADEVLGFSACRTAPDVGVFNPAFDVTPHALITAIITERAIIRP